MTSTLDDISREFLRVVDECGGRASTQEIRERTELNKREIHYRYDKLDELGLITVERDETLTSEFVPAMKIAVLTDEARKRIQEGLLNPIEDGGVNGDVSVDELEERVSELEDGVRNVDEVLRAEIIPRVLMLQDAIGRIELLLEREGIDVASLSVGTSKQRELFERSREKQDEMANKDGSEDNESITE